MSAVCIVYRLLYKAVLRLGISLYTYRRSVAVVAVVASDVTMLSNVALFSDLLVVYVEVEVALTLLLHRT